MRHLIKLKHSSLVLLAAGNVLTSMAGQFVVLLLVGPGRDSDAYVAGQTLPSVMLAIVVSGLTRVLIPLVQQSGNAARGFLWQMAAVLFVPVALLSAGLVASASLWVPILVPGFDAELIKLTVRLTQIQCTSMPFVALAAVLTAGYHAQLHFQKAEGLMLLANAAAMAALFPVVEHYGVFGAAWVYLLRSFLTTAMLARILGRYVSFQKDEPLLAMALARLKPLIAGSALVKLGPFLDRSIASFAVAGSMSLLYLVQQAYTAVLQVIDRSVAARFVGRVGALRGDPGSATARNLYRRHLVISVAMASVAFALAILVALLPAVTSIEMPGLTPLRLSILQGLAVTLGLMLTGVSGQLSAGWLYALGRTADVTRCSLYTFGLSSLIKIAGFLYFGIYGLAFGIASSQWINAILLYLILIRKSGNQHA